MSIMALLANGKRHTKEDLRKNPVKKIPKKTLNISVSKLNETHKTHLINFFDEDSTATIQNEVENLDLIRMSKVEDILRYNLAT